MTHGPLHRYRALAGAGALQNDPSQVHAASMLDALHRKLDGYRPGGRGLFGFGAVKPPPRGLYLHGDVGRGKSLLMDLFFAHAPALRKRRVHFNAFMAETHGRIHEWRGLSNRERARRPEFVREAGDDPILPIAKRIAGEAHLLCFDEFQVMDVADAMILGRLFENLLERGTVIVVTSNTPPERLYEGGLNRQLFLPFIALIKTNLDSVALDGPQDYRLARMAGVDRYLTPLGQETGAAMDAAWRRLTGTTHGEPAALRVMGRKLAVPEAANGVARFSFDALCVKPLGAADYLALAETFHTLLIDHVPQMDATHANEARRFTLLIDALYEQNVKLVCSAAAEPFALYRDGTHAEAFRRTASRLVEMQSEDYLKLGHGSRGARAVSTEPA